MKNILIYFTTALFIASCNDDPSPQKEKLTGVWLPYEIVEKDGRVYEGPIHAMSIFGVYAEAVQFNNDKTYVPVMWVNANDFDLKTIESGEYHIISDTLKLTGGAWDMEFAIEHFDSSELWLRHTGDVPLLGDSLLYKMKREVTLN